MSRTDPAHEFAQRDDVVVSGEPLHLLAELLDGHVHGGVAQQGDPGCYDHVVVAQDEATFVYPPREDDAARRPETGVQERRKRLHQRYLAMRPPETQFS